jgi:hypothetical protein
MIVVFFEPPSRFAVLFSDKPIINLKTRTHGFSRSFSIFHFHWIFHLSFAICPFAIAIACRSGNDK